MYILPQTTLSQKETYHQFPQNTGQDLTIPNIYTQNIYNYLNKTKIIKLYYLFLRRILKL